MKARCDNCGKEFKEPEDKLSNKALVLGVWKQYCSTDCWRELIKPNQQSLVRNSWNYTKFDN